MTVGNYRRDSELRGLRNKVGSEAVQGHNVRIWKQTWAASRKRQV